MITVDDILTSSGRHADRIEWVSPKVASNAKDLAARVNKLMLLAGVKRTITSGFRDVDSNKKLKNASPYSRHLTGQAADIEDAGGTLGAWALQHEAELAQCGLYVEHPMATKTWVHVQVTAPPSGKRIFKP